MLAELSRFDKSLGGAGPCVIASICDLIGCPMGARAVSERMSKCRKLTDVLVLLKLARVWVLRKSAHVCVRRKLADMWVLLKLVSAL